MRCTPAQTSKGNLLDKAERAYLKISSKVHDIFCSFGDAEIDWYETCELKPQRKLGIHRWHRG